MSEPATPSPHSFTPPRLHPAPGSGDGWVEDGTGAKFWGRFGAAGLLAHDPARGILLQHRANWSHFGGTWGLPGGARHESETPVQGAIREASEEAGVVVEALSLTLTSTFDLGFWSYTTVVVDVTAPFVAAATDAESIEVRWVPVTEVAALPLHPGFGASWPTLQAELGRRTVLIVDSANVVGSRPDGWWKDRAAATERLAARLTRLSQAGFAADALGIDLPGTHWWPDVRLVVEGAARGARLPVAPDAGPVALVAHVGPVEPVAPDPAVPAAAVDAPSADAPSSDAAPADAVDAPSGDVAARGGDVTHADTPMPGTSAADIAPRLTLVAAERDGDQAIVDEVAALFAAPEATAEGEPTEAAETAPAPRVFVVTADRELAARVTDLGATVLGPRWLLTLLDAV